MKGEYVIESKNDNNNNNNSMFAKFHHQHSQQQHHHHHQHQQHQHFPPPQIPHTHHHQFQVSPQCQTSEEDDTSRSSGGAATNTNQLVAATGAKPTKSSEYGDGATIEVVRRPRGRPPGSKNKPKPPVIITREPEPAMSPYILEVPGGADIIETIARFSRRRNIGLCVLSGSGTVANVSLRQPSNTPASTVIFHGRYDILSISATFLHPTSSSQVPTTANHIAISLAGPQGQIFGGAVAGPLLAAGPVFIIAASFNHPSYHRLPVEEEGHNSASGGNDNSSPPQSGGGDSGHTPPGESGGMSMFNCHLPSDVIWAPTARQPQQQQQQPPPPPPPY